MWHRCWRRWGAHGAVCFCFQLLVSVCDLVKQKSYVLLSQDLGSYQGDTWKSNVLESRRPNRPFALLDALLPVQIFDLCPSRNWILNWMFQKLWWSWARMLTDGRMEPSEAVWTRIAAEGCKIPHRLAIGDMLLVLKLFRDWNSVSQGVHLSSPSTFFEDLGLIVQR